MDLDPGIRRGGRKKGVRAHGTDSRHTSPPPASQGRHPDRRRGRARQGDHGPRGEAVRRPSRRREEYAETREPTDEVVEDKGVTILIEPKAVLFLIGAEIDYEVSKLSSKFVFHNPNETDACGCGESVTIQPAAEVQD